MNTSHKSAAAVSQIANSSLVTAQPRPTIAFVADTIYPYSKGGREKRLYEVSIRLARRGYNVHIYTMKWWPGPKHVVEQGVHLHAICKNYPLYKGERRAVWPGLAYGLACLKLLGQAFDVVDVDHMPFFPLYSVWLVCRLRRKRMYATWHEVWGRQYWTDYMGWLGNVAALVERLSVHLPHAINSISDHTSQLLRQRLGRTSQVTTIFNGVDLAQIDRVQPADRPIDILCVSRLLKHKNVDLLLRSIALVKADRPAVRCTIVGNGPEKANLRRLATELNVAENLTFIDALEKSDDIYAYMKAAKVFVLPSEREGFGIVIIEAMACNVPVVTLDVPGNAARHLVQSGITGSVVAKTAPAVAAATIDWLDASGPRAVDQHVRHYDWQPISEQLSQVYA